MGTSGLWFWLFFTFTIFNCADDIGPVSEEDQASVSEKLPRTIKAMEMALGNQQLLECLVEKGIVEILLSLYDLKISTRPGDVATFHTILATMRLFLANKPDLIAKPIAESLSKRLEKAKEQALVSPPPSLPPPPSAACLDLTLKSQKTPTFSSSKTYAKN